MSRKSYILLLLMIVLPVAAYLLIPSDEARIKKLIRNSAAAAEMEDMDKLMSAVDYNYTDNHGLSYLYLKKILEQEFGRVSGIDVEYENLVIRVEGEKARAGMDLRVIASMGEARGYYLGDLENPLELKVEMEKGPTGKWAVLRAHYETGVAPF
jgi:hypothetical protein